MSFLVEKPQFNTAELSPGTPVSVKCLKSSNCGDWYGFSSNCIVLSATPLEVTLVYVGKEKGGYHDEKVQVYKQLTQTLSIDYVANGTVTIDKLGVQAPQQQKGLSTQ